MEVLDNILCWSDFNSEVNSLSNNDRGFAFESLCKLYFEVHPPLASLYIHVWTWKDVPHKVKEELSLPTQDLGIDLLCKAEDGYHAVQCKYHSDPASSVSFKEVSTFLSLFESRTGITKGYICTTAELESRNLNLVRSKDISLIQSDTWEALDEDFFEKARKKLSGQRIKLEPYQPRTHQKKALRQAKKHFIDNDESRGKLIFPCGSGKSLTGYWMTEKLESKSTIIAVPSLALVKQTLEVYLREVTAKKKKVKWLCICSDEGIGKGDDVVTYTENIGVPCVTDQEYIEKWLNKHKEDEIFIFTTYQSGRIIGEVSKKLDFTFDLGIYDEAHKTVGAKDKLFSYLLFDENIDVRKRVFMTATERFYGGKKDDILSMDDTSVYGDIFAHMSFKEAIKAEPPLLTDYKVITLQVTDEEIADFIKENMLVQLNDKWKKESEARSLASMIALRKAMSRYPIRNAVSFHSSIEKAKRNKDIHTHLTKHYQYPSIETFTVSGKLPTTKRTKIVREFADSEKALITNARCLTEGVDVPNIDCIVFADPKRSKIDIVQALGRALRKKEGKEWGYVILPVIFDEKKKEVDNKSFNDILAVVRALAANDERIVEYLRDKEAKNDRKASKNDQFDFEVIADSINEDQLKEELEIKLWDNIAKLNWRSYKEAQEIIKKYKFQSAIQFKTFMYSEERIKEIPTNPSTVYKNEGWTTWGNFLGTDRISDNLKTYRDYTSASIFATSLNFNSAKEWRAYVKSNQIPKDIPRTPNEVYANQGWTTWGDFLGTNTISNYNKKFRQFEEARKFIRSLNIQNTNDWREYCISGQKPDDIPSNPDSTYKGKGWIDIKDWLGTKISYLPFSEAKYEVQKLGISSYTQWLKFSKSKDFPDNIPQSPSTVYKTEWKGWGDWLGTNIKATRYREFLSFEAAKEFVRTLELKSQKEWKNYCKSGKKPESIPANPNRTYKDKGWVGYGDWLGNEYIPNQKRVYLPYAEAKEFVKKLGFSSSTDWYKYRKSGDKPENIPANPRQVYNRKGWKGWPDFLGNK